MLSVAESQHQSPTSYIDGDIKLWPVTTVLIILVAFDSGLYCLFDIEGSTRWTRIYTIEGLLLDALGAIIVVGGDWSPIRPYFYPGTKIERMRSAKDQVVKGENIEKDDKGFKELRSIIYDAKDISKRFPNEESKDVRPIKEQEVIRFDIARSSKRYIVSMGGGGDRYVYPVWEDDEWSKEKVEEQHAESLSRGATLPNHVWTPEERLDSVGSPSLVEEWIGQRLRRLENSAKQTALNIGLSFFVLGFSIQIVAQL